MEPRQALRDHRAHARRTPFRDHHAQGGSLRARLPQARGPIRQRHRDRPVAPGLHCERDGAQSAGSRAGRSIRRHHRSRGEAVAHPARSRGVVLRRSSAHAQGGPVHRRLRPQARRRAREGRRNHGVTPRYRLQGADQGRVGQIARVAQSVAGALVHRQHGASRGVPSRAPGSRPRAGPGSAAQGRSRPYDRRRREDETRQDSSPGGALP